jgi:hypothetical protein
MCSISTQLTLSDSLALPWTLLPPRGFRFSILIRLNSTQLHPTRTRRQSGTNPHLRRADRSDEVARLPHPRRHPRTALLPARKTECSSHLMMVYTYSAVEPVFRFSTQYLRRSMATSWPLDTSPLIYLLDLSGQHWILKITVPSLQQLLSDSRLPPALTDVRLLVMLAECCGGFVEREQDQRHLRSVFEAADYLAPPAVSLYHQDGTLVLPGTILNQLQTQHYWVGPVHSDASECLPHANSCSVHPWDSHSVRCQT